MPLLETEEHKKYHELGPKDVYWGKPNWKNKKDVVMSIQVQRSTIDSEQISFSVPVFEEDSRLDLKERLGFAFSIVQDRLDDANRAWQEAADKAEVAKEKKK